MIDCIVMVQARMSSSRFPGKVLAPLAGQPLIAHLLHRICEAVPKNRVVLLTSDQGSDDPLAAYVSSVLGMMVFRGPLDDVVGRFQCCLREHPCEWFVRICGDSPVIDPALLGWMLDRASPEFDLVTNVANRTFPAGQSIEIVRAGTFLSWNRSALTVDEREHVTLKFYRSPGDYTIRNVSCTDRSVSARRLVVDTLEDLRAVERVLKSEPSMTRGYATRAVVGEGAA